MTITIIGIIILIAIFSAKYSNNNLEMKRTIGIMFQMLESFNIIDNTVKYEVFSQRLDFLGTLAHNIPNKTNNLECAKIALQKYSKKYSNVTCTFTYNQILGNPSITYSDKFRDEAATAFYMRSCDKLKTEIESLKTKAAKQRRIKQAEELSDMIKERLCSSDKQKYINAINESFEKLTTFCPS